MKKRVSLLVAVLLALLAADSLAQPPQPRDSTPCEKVDPRDVQVPADFSIQYSPGPAHASWATTTWQVNAGEEFIVSEQRQGQPWGAPPVVVRQSLLGQEAVKRPYAQVLGCRFFEMAASYWNRRVVDGGTQRLAVTANGKQHQVTVHHYQVTRFNALVAALKREGGE